MARGTDVVAEPELVELGPEDLPSVTALLGERPAAESRWVGVKFAEQLVAAAGWLATDHGVRLLGPVIDTGMRDQAFEDALIGAVEEIAAEEAALSQHPTTADIPVIEANARGPLTVDRLRSLGYRGEVPVLCRRLPDLLAVPTAEAMRALGRHLAGLLRAGDLVIATGDLGAGKTTLTQGIGAGLGVDEPVTSPTFVLSRIHPGADGAPDLVHVDAYRLADSDEVDDIDLDHDLDRSVTVIEWGAGLAEQLVDHRLEIDIRRSENPADESRLVILRPVGERWAGVRLVPLEGTEQ
ncbi:tRNA (adenosine(37)-N6)-threonylcarbamoyltransferase complex ATPase subunit type 1 TsaE [Granulicoccus sp. GXG6511]|uniref:tRNA (adenosine(37)-N6)-threonylcarbamoyltransferase complex ATPase subunit type 1 TsaE n=1 Tax=Granulicoccus sp. GXG6511 TaxID=3381351 RepID=UPI003D7E4D92